MKINDASKKPVDGVATPVQARGGKPVAKSDAAPASDRVQISSQSATFAGEVGASGAVFDTAKVAEIKAAIANGSFTVNAERIADGLIDTVRDLIHHRKA